MQINKLIIFGGPPCSGKSTLIKKITLNEIPSISNKLGINERYSHMTASESKGLTRFVVTSEIEVPTLHDSQFERMILHYDFFRPIRLKHIQSYGEDESLKILSKSNEIIFVTLWARPDVLKHRLHLRKWQRLRRFMNPPGFTKVLAIAPGLRFLGRLKKYGMMYNSKELLYYYNNWFDFCNTFDGKAHWIADTSEDKIRLVPLSEWRTINKTI